MKKWEYCELRHQSHIGKSKLYIVEYKKDGKHKRKEVDYSNRGKLIAKLGGEGWELITADSGYLFFKRPLED